MRVVSFSLMLAIAIFLITVASVTRESRAQTDVQLKPTEVFDKIPAMRLHVQKNMVSCEESLLKITSALPKGDYETIELEAKKIDEEYGIESGMDPDDVAEYNSLISPEFTFMDQDLHQYSNALATAAHEMILDQTLVMYDLTLRSCVNCHYEWAGEKFPSLARSVTEY
jgi:hypothetical protein